MRPFLRVLALLVGPLLFACGLATTRPKLEMGYAQVAILAAKSANAEAHAPALFRKAEYYYLKAKSAYRKKYFNKAKQYALLSRRLSERAEYTSVRKKAMNNL